MKKMSNLKISEISNPMNDWTNIKPQKTDKIRCNLTLSNAICFETGKNSAIFLLNTCYLILSFVCAMKSPSVSESVS